MQEWQKERKDSLADLVLGAHVLTYLLTIVVLLISQGREYSSFINDNYYTSAAVLISILLPMTIFAIFDFTFLKKKESNSLFTWNIIKHVVLFATITLVFATYNQEKVALLWALYLLPVVLAGITLGQKWGLIFAGLANICVYALNLLQPLAGRGLSFEVSLALGSIFFIVAWFTGSITDLEAKTTKNLAKMANEDSLTGLYNHRSLHEKLDKTAATASYKKTSLSLLLLDIDYFKRYNDTYGHIQGDMVLKEIADLLRDNVPPGAFLARYGGEEFAVILAGSTLKEAANLADDIRSAVENHEFSGELSQPYSKLTVSIGVANIPQHAKNASELLAAVDEALYSCKFTGRNKVRSYLAVLEKLSAGAGGNERELINSLRTLITVINAKDKYTYGHSERVTYYAKEMGCRLNLSRQELQLLEYGAFLHDIGKLEISREILNKKDGLLEEDWKIIHQHPIWGAEIIKSVASLKPAIPMVLYHHENYDGSGYPFGLKGDEIPLFARILRVADSFDAIVSNRPYSSSMALDEALEELLRCRGYQYDPQIVKVFLEAMKSIKH